MKTVILCGGKGTRLHEETEHRPKPMVQIGGRPILWHIMKMYAHWGFKDFVLCLGHKGHWIKDYFYNYEVLNHDFTIDFRAGRRIEIHERDDAQMDWSVTLADTGESSMTGARLKRVARYLGGDRFMLTYGDGVADIDLTKLVEFHRSHGKIGTVTGVRPLARFGELVVDGQCVRAFSEKPLITNAHINGGFFVFERSFLDYLDEDASCVLEREPLERLAASGELMTYTHDGFWHCMDTLRDHLVLNRLWNDGAPPWRVWAGAHER